MRIDFLISLLLTLTTSFVSAQNRQQVEPGDYLAMKWKKVATGMPSEWYGSNEAKLVAENLLIAQKDAGGWEKNKNYHRISSESEKEKYIEGKPKMGATFDNGATITELRFLAKVYSNFKDERYKLAFNKGLDYIFVSQYENGGWPQFYPLKGGYADHITYNDNAMVNTMDLLHEIISGDSEFTLLQISTDQLAKAQNAFDMGIECILNTQIIVEGKPTVWCAQHDEKTLAPANARSYELASFSGGESVGIILLLMDINKPSDEIIASVDEALKWFEKHEIKGIRIERFVNQAGKRDRMVVEDAAAPTLWARFYDLETSKPFFCSRDGIKKDSLAEISFNRRNGYSWYTKAPHKVLKKYSKWKKELKSE